MPISIEVAALNLALALFCGALIGSERQVRQRMAGLRTNALVALSAAAFVVFSALFPDEVSPTRVAAQVVSGIGFLGAGIIFRHGFTIHGLNTAATLWCSAAVGMMAGTGAWLFALMMTGFVIFVNLGLRPLVKWLKRTTRAGVPLTQEFKILLQCKEETQADARVAVLKALAQNDIRIVGFEKGDSADGSQTIAVLVSMEDHLEELQHKVVAPLMLEPSIESIEWDSVSEA
ncbi:MgtC/SapB family protein [Ruegeria sp. 6PALISEP08]|uniref:MgtC/SapB family protein n=1 Tax=Ruegeria sp. 6PALISEP08 TaxID=1225660 RepID=UPI00067E75B1|nr:MgtC/SapB family protein [Ruegeria sp. 6PALISEP08]